MTGYSYEINTQVEKYCIFPSLIVGCRLDLFAFEIQMLFQTITYTHTEARIPTSTPPCSSEFISFSSDTLKVKGHFLWNALYPRTRSSRVCLHVRSGKVQSPSSRLLPHLPSLPQVSVKKKNNNKTTGDKTHIRFGKTNTQIFTLKSWKYLWEAPVCVSMMMIICVVCPSPCVLCVSILHCCQVECLPPDCELQYPVRSLDEDEGFLSAAVEGGSVYVNELVAHF